ncbi:MAG: AAA family ATPase [Planctomycetes bacterium]|nr:AAA family ATPase [Planctomycetota bacterium]
MHQVLTDAEAEPVPRPTRRDVVLPQRTVKVDAVIGMRRVGKSWLLLHRMRELLDAGVPRSLMLHVEFEDDRLADLRTEDLHLIEEAFFGLHPESHGQECWFCFDEIQDVPGRGRSGPGGRQAGAGRSGMALDARMGAVRPGSTLRP